jgi:hypothetical protein
VRYYGFTSADLAKEITSQLPDVMEKVKKILDN